MTEGYRYTHPPEVTNEELLRLVGGPHVCPWCRRSRVPASRRNSPIAQNQYWVNTPLRRTGPMYVCVGCAIDVYSACNSSRFDTNMDRPLVEAVARGEGLTSEAFRRACWEHQMEIIREGRRSGTVEPGEEPLERRLLGLMEQNA